MYGYVQYKHHVTEKATYNYLIDKGYSDKDLINIKSKIKKLSLYTAEVTFVDEPNITYDYKVENKQVTPLGPTILKENYDYKHIE